MHARVLSSSFRPLLSTLYVMIFLSHGTNLQSNGCSISLFSIYKHSINCHYFIWNSFVLLTTVQGVRSGNTSGCYLGYCQFT
jgi:hypothetical protein